MLNDEEQPEPKPDLNRPMTIKEGLQIIEACEKMVSQIAQAHYDLSNRFGKFSVIWEEIFQKEITARLSPQSGNITCGQSISELSRLKRQMQR